MSYIITNDDITSKKLAEVMEFNQAPENLERATAIYEHITKTLCEKPAIDTLALEIQSYMIAAMLEGKENFEFTRVAQSFFVLGLCYGFDVTESIIRDKSLEKLNTTPE